MSKNINYSKAMIQLVYGIRKRVPADFKPTVKMANPELFDELIPFYQGSKDTVTKALIKELFFLCGEPWISALNETNNSQKTPNMITKVYRGQNSLVPAKNNLQEPEKQKSKKVYRGQVVDS